MLPVLRIALACILAVALLFVGATWVGRSAPNSWLGRLAAHSMSASRGSSPQSGGQTELADLAIGGPFTLVDSAGRTVTQAGYPGRWLLIYFGYTSCPDVCPTTLQAMAGALQALGPKASGVVPLFITVDPGRDQPDVLARYTALFDPRIVGLTGTPEQIGAAEKAYRVYAARVDSPKSGSYLMDHSSFIYLMDPSGHLRALFDRDVTSAAIAARLNKVLT